QPVEKDDSGVTRRMIPGKVENQVVIVGSEEHNEYGRITESAEVRTAMMNRRMKKLASLKEEMMEPDYFGAEKPEHLLIGWGSLYGPLKEVVENLQDEGISVGALVFGDI